MKNWVKTLIIVAVAAVLVAGIVVLVMSLSGAFMTEEDRETKALDVLCGGEVSSVQKDMTTFKIDEKYYKRSDLGEITAVYYLKESYYCIIRAIGYGDDKDSTVEVYTRLSNNDGIISEVYVSDSNGISGMNKINDEWLAQFDGKVTRQYADGFIPGKDITIAEGAEEASNAVINAMSMMAIFNEYRGLTQQIINQQEYDFIRNTVYPEGEFAKRKTLDEKWTKFEGKGEVLAVYDGQNNEVILSIKGYTGENDGYIEAYVVLAPTANGLKTKNFVVRRSAPLAVMGAIEAASDYIKDTYVGKSKVVDGVIEGNAAASAALNNCIFMAYYYADGEGGRV